MIHFDGASDPNPGYSGYAFTHFDSDSKEVYWECGYIGSNKTNNVAEYTALFKALTYCYTNQLYGMQIKGDSLLVVNQVNKKWKIKSESLRFLHSQCHKLLVDCNATLVWVPRENNKRADELSKIPLLKRYTCSDRDSGGAHAVRDYHGCAVER